MKHSYAIGYLAEWLCILRLWLTGWRVLAHRWKHPVGEVDLIAKRGNTIVFIEVKARRSLRLALESIHPNQQIRISRAASQWLMKHPQFSGHTLRFDVMWLALWPWPGRLADAFRL